MHPIKASVALLLLTTVIYLANQAEGGEGLDANGIPVDQTRRNWVFDVKSSQRLDYPPASELE